MALNIMTDKRKIGMICLKHPEFNGLRLKSNNCCVECACDKVKAQNKTEKYKLKAKTPERKAYDKNYRANNRTSLEDKEKASVEHKEWAAKNPHSVNEIAAQRRSKKREAAPNWGPADRQLIKDKHEFCVLWSKLTGIKHHVDHGVSLDFDENDPKGVCGLHVSCNLRIITAFENMSKHNDSFIPEEENWNEFAE